jgi:hypothetical protein
MNNQKEEVENKEDVLKKREDELKKREEAIKQQEEALNQKKEAFQKEIEAFDANNEPDERFRPDTIDRFDPAVITDIRGDIAKASKSFKDMSDNMLRPRERRRKIGPGIRNLGYLQKTGELAQANPQFAQMFDVQNLMNCLSNIDGCRSIIVELDGFERRVRDSMLTYSDEAYSMALMFYSTVQEMSRRGDGDARSIFNMLRPIFRTKGRAIAAEEEPSQKQIERDVHAVLTGKKTGKVVVEGEAKHTAAAEHTVVDDTYKPQGAFKETVHGTFCTHCNTHNVENARFCVNCGADLQK